MSTKAERGTKRTCQNPECGSRFYDLNRDPVTCPDLPDRLPARGCAPRRWRLPPLRKGAARKAPKKPVYAVEAAKPEDAPEAEADDPLAAIEGDEEPAAADEDETFLEAEEEDGSDMSNIIGGPVAEPDEPQ